MPIGHSPKDTEGAKEPPDNPTTSTGQRCSKRTALDMTYEEKSTDDNPLTLSDLMNQLKSNEAAIKLVTHEIRNDISILRGEMTQQINGLKMSFDEMSSNVDDISMQVEGLEKRFDVVSTTANENRKMINSFQQDKLEKKMEIDGIKDSVINSTDDFKKLALDTIESFGIAVSPNDIEYAYKKEITLKKKINNSDKKLLIVVIFTNVSTKIRVMKAKRDQKTECSIYFNTALTVVNRNLIYKAKQIVKGKLKVYFARGCVRVLKKDKNEIMVQEEAHLNLVQQYFDQTVNQQ